MECRTNSQSKNKVKISTTMTYQSTYCHQLQNAEPAGREWDGQALTNLPNGSPCQIWLL